MNSYKNHKQLYEFACMNSYKNHTVYEFVLYNLYYNLYSTNCVARIRNTMCMIKKGKWVKYTHLIWGH